MYLSQIDHLNSSLHVRADQPVLLSTHPVFLCFSYYICETLVPAWDDFVISGISNVLKPVVKHYIIIL